MTINQHLNESVNHRGSRTHLKKCDVHPAYQELCSHEPLVEVNTVDLKQDFYLWKASFSSPWSSQPSFWRCLWVVLQTGAWACTWHCSSRPLHQTLWPLSAADIFPSMRVADFIKVHSTFSQGGWSLRREEGALQACCQQYRECSIKKEHLLSG